MTVVLPAVWLALAIPLPSSPSGGSVALTEAHGVYTIEVRNGAALLWTARTAWPLALNDAQHRTVVFGAPDRPILTCRSYRGAKIWSLRLGTMDRPPDVYVAGGHTLICHLYGHGAYDWESDPIDDARRQTYACLDTVTGHVRWRATRYQIGAPVWTNGVAFISIKHGLSPDRASAAKSGRRPLDVYMEVRRVSNLRVLWRRRLSGYPGPLTVVTVSGQRAKMVFAPTPGDMPFVQRVGPLTLSVPLPVGQQGGRLSMVGCSRGAPEPRRH